MRSDPADNERKKESEVLFPVYYYKEKNHAMPFSGFFNIFQCFWVNHF